MQKTFYLMRHGQTLFNVQGRIQGACDSPLTELGIAQAKAARDYFEQEGIRFDSIYSSTQERACDTAELVTGRKDYIRLKGLKEWNFGSFEAHQEYLNPPLHKEDGMVPAIVITLLDMAANQMLRFINEWPLL